MDEAELLKAAKAKIFADFPMVEGHPDIAGVLRQPCLLALLGSLMAAPFRSQGITVVCAPEARGPILGALVAVQLNAGLVLVRKNERNHPGADTHIESGPTWRGSSETFQFRSWDLAPGDRVLVVDDWITTGSSLTAVHQLITHAGAIAVGTSVIVNKAHPETLERLRVRSLVDFDQLVDRDA